MFWVVSFEVDLFFSSTSSPKTSGLDFDDEEDERRTLRGMSSFDLLLIIDVEFLLLLVYLLPSESHLEIWKRLYSGVCV